MKQLIKLGILSNVLLCSTAFALNSVQGFYGGFLVGISHGPSSNRVTFREDLDPKLYTGTVDYSIVGAGGGGVIGYKLNHYRMEGEILYNQISTGPFKIDPGGCTIENIGIVTPTGLCTPGEYDQFRAKTYGYRGTSRVTYGLINFYYDFFCDEQEIVPYIGLGIGTARIQNFNNLINSITKFSRGIDNKGTITSSAMQGIIGTSYYMDDLTWIGVDLRYTTTSKALPLFDDKKYNLAALMFNINFAFDKGGFDC